MRIRELRQAGHALSLLAGFLHFDVSLMCWVLLARWARTSAPSPGSRPGRRSPRGDAAAGECWLSHPRRCARRRLRPAPRPPPVSAIRELACGQRPPWVRTR